MADLSWSPADGPGAAQRVDLTTVQDGFSSGRFDSSPALPPTTTSYTWPTVNPNGVHIWRVETQHGSDWVASGEAQFTGPVCVGDVANPPG